MHYEFERIYLTLLKEKEFLSVKAVPVTRRLSHESTLLARFATTKSGRPRDGNLAVVGESKLAFHGKLCVNQLAILELVTVHTADGRVRHPGSVTVIVNLVKSDVQDTDTRLDF